MKILSIGTDRKLFENDSAVVERVRSYGTIFEELHIIVYTRRREGFVQKRIAENVFVYPTNSFLKLLALRDALRQGSRLLLAAGEWKITTQDPFESGFAGWLLKKKFHYPLQLQIHSDIFSTYFLQESLLNRIRVLVAKFLLPRANGIRVVSRRIRDSIVANCRLKQGISSVTVLPIFVDIKKIRSSKITVDLHQRYPGFDYIILMASRLTREKNIQLAINAMKEILASRSSVQNSLLLIVGDGPEKVNLKLQIANLKLERNVIIESWSDNLVSYYRTADAFLLTSQYEGYGRTVIESMAGGLPVVMTDVGLSGEVVINDVHGIIVPVGDRDAITEALQSLLRNKDKQARLTAEFQRIADTFLSEGEYLEEYRKALASCV